MSKLQYLTASEYRKKCKIEHARLARNRMYERIRTLENSVFVLTGQRPRGWYAVDRQVTPPNNLSPKERNRVSAARSRERRRNYICELEAVCLEQQTAREVVMINNATNNGFFLNDTELLRT